MRPSIDSYFLAMAQLVATRATCLRRQVGCVLVDERRHVLATGYNGVPAGLPHCNEPDTEGFGPEAYPWACPGAKAASGTQLDGCRAVHAEQNALLQCPDVHRIHACYCTTRPCLTCTKLLLNTSCQRVIFLEEYPHIEAISLWVQAGRSWTQGNLPY